MWGVFRMMRERSTRWILAVSCALCVVAGAAIAKEPAFEHVLPPQAEPVLRSALVGAKGPTKLPISKVTLTSDHVTLSFEGGANALTLRHPSVTAGALKVTPAFSLHGDEVPSAIITSVAARLSGVEASSVWRKVAKAEPAPAPSASTGARSHRDPKGLVTALHAAREAVRVGELDKVAGLVAPYVEVMATLSEPARIDVATLLWRSGDIEGAGRLVKGITGESGGRAIQWQAALLRGESPSLEELIASIKEADDPCEGLAVAELLKALDKPQVAMGLVSHLASLTPACPKATVQEVHHLLATG